jgi:hypothetical protein
MCFIYAPRDAKERKIIETLLDAAIWFATGFDHDTRERVEDILDNLPPPPARKPKNTWQEMSTIEQLSHIADRGSDISDEVFDVVWNWGLIRLGSVALVVWIVGLHTVLNQSYVYSYWAWFVYRFG